ncbi:hypothetical protein HNR46_002777 [Haloferula luteola]|uniref:Uncharacterized protein n=1 Tax=Haloferula luteola TaxID=595692 RepID=A0A840VIJ9_9BACT|nr:hypothetical protein [Haloferula luteola]MBB5352531.1 hypothetical protein [Haloferula luteola]
MALRIAGAVIRGEIDNTLEGRTTGRLWMVGASEPVSLDLTGDCWRDLAGARLQFTNSRPFETVSLNFRQKGLVGDMTASRKARVPTCDLSECLAREAAGEVVPMVWKNELYLEWFDESQGRILLESCDYQLRLSEAHWTMDADAEEAQKLANLQAMRDFLTTLIARPDASEGSARDDEFAWEQRLQQSDRLTDAYQEVLEKYMDDPDAEQKEAFVMGWDGLLGAMADDLESDLGLGLDWSEDSGEELYEESDDDEFEVHPLQEEAQDLAIRSIDLLRNSGNGAPHAQRIMNALSLVAAKLAGALNGHYQREQGYVLAILKRCLDAQNEALEACSCLLSHTIDPDQRIATEALRGGIFELRGKITEMRRELSGR